MTITKKSVEGDGMYKKVIMAGIVLATIISCNKESAYVMPEAEACGAAEEAFIVRAAMPSHENTETKMSYATGEYSLVPSWEKGDTIIGFDDAGQKFTFTVTSVDQSGVAEMDPGSYAPGKATTLYALYAPGKTVGDIKNKAVSIDLSGQSGAISKSSPLIMCATGLVEQAGEVKSVSLKFVNQMAVVEIRKVKITEDVDEVESVSLNGVMTKGSIELTEQGLAVVPSGEKNGLSLKEVDLDKPVYFIVLPDKEAALSIMATTASDETLVNTKDIPNTELQAGKLYGMAKELGVPAAQIPELGRYYGTLGKALADVKSAGVQCTVKLLSDRYEDTLTLESPVRTKLDLNGHELRTAMTMSGKVEICDSSKDKKGSWTIPTSKSADGDIYGRNIDLKAGSELEISDVTITGRTASPSSYDHIQAIRCNGTSSNRAKLTVNGGNLIGKSQAGIVLVNHSDVVVNNGNFNSSGTYGRNFRVRAGAILTVNGGTFYSEQGNFVQYSTNSDTNTTINIVGGNLSTKGVMFNFAPDKNVKLAISGGNMATPSGVAIFGGNYVGSSTRTITGGKFSADCSSLAPAASGYVWKKMAMEDGTTIPGFTLTHEVVKQ